MFITFEGLDGSGKSTQAHLLRARLEREGDDAIATREPGGTELGERIRELLLHGGHVTPWAEALLYAASRVEHVEQIIRPALERGAFVICDRYVDSSAAYQGGARGLGVERVLDLNLVAVGGLMPDRTFLLELDPTNALDRMGPNHDRLEREGNAFRALAAAAYKDLADRFPERYVVLDGTRDGRGPRAGHPWIRSLRSLSRPRRSGCSRPPWAGSRRRTRSSSTGRPESGSAPPRSRSRPRSSVTRGASRRARIPTCTSSSRSGR